MAALEPARAMGRWRLMPMEYVHETGSSFGRTKTRGTVNSPRTCVGHGPKPGQDQARGLALDRVGTVVKVLGAALPEGWREAPAQQCGWRAEDDA